MNYRNLFKLFTFVLLFGVVFSTLGVRAEIFLYKNRNETYATDKFVFKVKPGDTIQDKFEIVNSNNSEQNLKITSTNPIVTGAGALAPNLSYFDPTINLNIETKNIALKAKKSVFIDFTTTIPSDLKDGEYLTFIYVESQQDTKSQAQIGARINKTLKIFFQVNSDFTLSTKLNNLNIIDPADNNFQTETGKLKYLGRQNLVAAIDAENTGNIFGRIEGEYRLLQNGKEIKKDKAVFDLVPGVGARTFYIITNVAYAEGENRVEFDYKIVPQNVPSESVKYVNASGKLDNAVKLTKGDLDKFSNVSYAAIQTEQQRIEKLSLQISQNPNQENQSDKIDVSSYIMLGLIVVLVGIAGVIFGIRYYQPARWQKIVSWVKSKTKTPKSDQQ
jgi:hypothetical protein